MNLQCHLYEGYIRGGLHFTGIHERIEEWMITVPGAHYDKTTDISWINGVTYYHRVSFLTEEDLVAFKLTFAGFVST
jgi:hypothetical protein